MKLYLVFLLFWVMPFNVFSEEICINENIKGTIIYKSESTVIFESKDLNRNPIFWVASEILNFFLPDVANFVCLNVIGEENKEICNAIYNGLDFITSLASVRKKSIKLVRELLEMTAERGVKKSGLYFASHSAELVYNVMNTLEAYKKLGIVNWDNIALEDGGIYSKNSSIGTITIKNRTEKSFVIQVSNDGENWKEIEIPPGNWKEIEIWNKMNKQSYGFVKGNNLCNYQLYTNHIYNLRYNNDEKVYYIEFS